MIFSGQSGRDGGRVFWDTVLHEFPSHSETVSLLSFPLIVNGLVVGIAMCNALRFSSSETLLKVAFFLHLLSISCRFALCHHACRIDVLRSNYSIRSD